MSDPPAVSSISIVATLIVTPLLSHEIRYYFIDAPALLRTIGRLRND